MLVTYMYEAIEELHVYSEVSKFQVLTTTQFMTYRIVDLHCSNFMRVAFESICLNHFHWIMM